MPNNVEQLRVTLLARKRLPKLGTQRHVAHLLGQALLCQIGHRRGKRAGWRRNQVIYARQVNAQVFGCLFHLGCCPIANDRQVVQVDLAKRARIGRKGQRRVMAAQQLRKMDDANQGMRGLKAHCGLVVVEDAVGHERVQVPAFDQPGPGVSMGNLKCVLLNGTKACVVLREKIEAVFVGCRGQ